jgi:hypothetical protein
MWHITVSTLFVFALSQRRIGNTILNGIVESRFSARSSQLLRSGVAVEKVHFSTKQPKCGGYKMSRKLNFCEFRAKDFFNSHWR